MKRRPVASVEFYSDRIEDVAIVFRFEDDDRELAFALVDADSSYHRRKRF